MVKKAVIVLNRPTCSLVANVHRLLYVNFVLQVRNTANKGYEQVCAKLRCWISWHLKHIRMIAAIYVSSVDLLLILYTRI